MVIAACSSLCGNNISPRVVYQGCSYQVSPHDCSNCSFFTISLRAERRCCRRISIVLDLVGTVSGTKEAKVEGASSGAFFQ